MFCSSLYQDRKSRSWGVVIVSELVNSDLGTLNSEFRREGRWGKETISWKRLIRFGVAVLDLGSDLPKTVAGRHMADQLMRSATAGAPDYAEARSGESIRDFVHKLGIVRKELNESLVWLRMLSQAGMGRVNSWMH
jgi:four helix bundle protein